MTNLNIPKKKQSDLIFVTERYSIWRDYEQWFLYDFRTGRKKDDGSDKNVPRPTYHPKLSQLVDHMVEGVMREELENLRHVEELVNTHKYQIFDFMQTVLKPWGRTPSDSCEKDDISPSKEKESPA